MRCKKSSIYLFTLLITSLFLLSCAPEPLTDEEIQEELQKLSDDELNLLINESEGQEGKAVAGLSVSRGRNLPTFNKFKAGAINSRVKKAPIRKVAEVAKKMVDSCNDDLSGKISEREVWSLDFEDLDEYGWPAEWTMPTGPTGKPLPPSFESPSFVIDSNVMHSGKNSLRISSPSTKSHGYLSLRGNSGRFKVAPNKEYVLSYWVRAENVVSLTNHLGFYQKALIELPSGSTSSVSGGKYWTSLFPSGKTPQSYEWKNVVSKFTIPENHDLLTPVILFQDGSGTVWIDDIELMKSDDYDNLPETTVEIKARSLEPAAPSRHYFLRGQKINTEAVLNERKGSNEKYVVKVELKYCNNIMSSSQKEINIGAHQRLQVQLLEIDTSSLALGDYMLTVTAEKEGQVVSSAVYPIGLRLEPEKDFLFSIWTSGGADRDSSLQKIDRLKDNKIMPLFSGELLDHVPDAALSRDISFASRLIPNLNFPPRIDPAGKQWSSPYNYGLSDPSVWEEAASWMKRAVSRLSHHGSFFSLIFTSDDFQVHSGWDWNENNKQRFKQQTGLEVPVPSEFKEKTPPYPVHTFPSISSTLPGGIANFNEPWLAFNKFLSKDVLGSYNKKITDAALQANPGVSLGPVPGGEQWPLFSTSGGQYPPSNFGKNGFNIASYYLYLKFWRPELAYIYWTDISRMNNGDISAYPLIDARIPEKSTIWNEFYLLLAAGVDGISYFIDDQASPEFWDVSKNIIGPVAEKFGSLFTKLEPEKRKVGLLVSQTTSIYNDIHPLDVLCSFNNLMMAHVDVEPVSEEEILAGKEYDLLILSDVDWITSDVAAKLSSVSYPVLLDGNSDLKVEGGNIKKTDLKFRDISCAAPPESLDYGDKDHLQAISSEVNKFLAPDVKIDSEQLIYRKYFSGDAEYLWLVDVHSKEEYAFMWDWATYKGGYKNPEIAVNYLDAQGVYTGKTNTLVSLKTAGEVVVSDVLTGKVLDSSFKDGWSTFNVDIPRLQGRLIALYQAAPNFITIDAPDLISGKEKIFSVGIHSAGGPQIKTVFPLYLEIKDPNGKVHDYTRYTATDEFGQYQLPVVIGTNDPKGTWSVKVKELSTGKENSKTFGIS